MWMQKVRLRRWMKKMRKYSDLLAKNTRLVLSCFPTS